MSDEERYRRRRRDIFDLFNDLFRELQEEMEEFERQISRRLSLSPDELRSMDRLNKPILYGFRIEIGPDGVPRIYEFGNVRRSERGRPRIVVSDEREPLTDIYEEDDKIRIVAEMPGVDENKIKVEAIDDRRIVIEASDHDRKYRKEVDLPAEVDIETAEAVYKNGVLEIKIRKRREGRRSRVIQIKKE
ncbi:MAG: Hsp20/alpha crystallin family protein [Ignisphaera sp.]|nr:Hsp20/alpha crystallin family protein [Ignisphaera sp.]MCX8168065.1 Hsp20/alpha crystallin family protein [Ignisphaera sp.]MDW8085746.1 archaeal heat shock protein Hsp20 [Ignisphaera sp.]